MIKRIKSSLTMKIFLVLTALLSVVSLLIYCIVMAVLPAGYEKFANEKYEKDMAQMVSYLEEETFENGIKTIKEFCYSHQVQAELKKDSEVQVFGKLNNESKKAVISAMAWAVQFENSDTEYEITFSYVNQAASGMTWAFRKLFPVVNTLILVISAASAFVFSKIVTRPVMEISRISQEMSGLNLNCRCSISRTDEMGKLAIHLNEMAEKLEKALKDLTDANQQLEEDIERERQREKMRVDFFRAVSHELKTPITVLRGRLEGMIYSVGEFKDRDAHLRSSLKTVSEMEYLVKEIIETSRMAEGDFSMENSEVDLSQLVRECSRNWQGAAEDREQNYTLNIKDGISCQGDRKLLKKAMSNVIGNAVMHSALGAKIEIALENGIFRVENSGEHIEEEKLKQIYEPFYRIDDSRSNKTGGSGLGLYIVKNVLERHDFRYDIGNTESGVQFRIFFT